MHCRRCFWMKRDCCAHAGTADEHVDCCVRRLQPRKTCICLLPGAGHRSRISASGGGIGKTVVIDLSVYRRWPPII